MWLLKISVPSHNAGIEVLMHSKNVKVGKLLGTSMHIWNRGCGEKEKKSQRIYLNQMGRNGSEMCED